ncbi:hypothetical protein SALBM311S_02977 [Streptomyces alboniger]
MAVCSRSDSRLGQRRLVLSVEPTPSVSESPKATTVPSASSLSTSSAVRYRQYSVCSVYAVPVGSSVRSPVAAYEI